jgi:peptidoglycan/xylan/chitin deacetylase (PgdA/CDA1 family)
MRGLAKSAALGASRAFGINRVSRRLMQGKLLALCYHGVVAERHADRFRYENTVSVAEFREQIEFVCRHYQVIRAADLIASRAEGKPLPPRAALITFDDGYRNNLLAAEVLRQLGAPGVFHVTTNYIGAQRILWTDEVMNRVMAWPSLEIPWPDGERRPLPSDAAQRREFAAAIKNACKKAPSEQVAEYLALLRQTPGGGAQDSELFEFLDWDGVRELVRQGFEIGSHTVDHPILSRVTPERLDLELTESRRRIEAETGQPCCCIAYPNGGREDISEQVFQAAKRAGYSAGFTIAERFSDPDENLMSISRVCVQGHLPAEVFECRASGADVLMKRFR